MRSVLGQEHLQVSGQIRLNGFNGLCRIKHPETVSILARPHQVTVPRTFKEGLLLGLEAVGCPVLAQPLPSGRNVNVEQESTVGLQ